MRLLPSLTRLGAVLFIASAAACHEPSAPADDADVRLAVETLTRLTDSLYQSGADESVLTSYVRLAYFLRTGGQATPVSIVVDGAPTPFLAMTQSAEPNQIYCVRAPCPQLPSLRTMIAWRRDDPRQVVQLTAVAGALIGASGPTISSRYVNTSTLTWLDGRGGFYVGTSGTQTVRLDRETDIPCTSDQPVVPLSSSISAVPNPTTCTLADFTVGFDAQLQGPVERGPQNNKATGTHTIGMREQHVTGTVLRLVLGYTCNECLLGEYPYPFTPPVDITLRTWLYPTLTATVSDVVTLRYTIKNTGTKPEVIQLPTSQRYDFAITTPAGFGVAWRWSADKVFAQGASTIVIPPSEQVVFTEQWTPTRGGDFIAYAQLTSSSHQANAAVFFRVPGS